jgi:hypothetical protein
VDALTMKDHTMSNILKDNLEVLEYDLNVFYEDLGDELAEVYTIQPSAYYVVKDSNASSRTYLKSFKLTLEETRAIAPDFPMDEYGDDFFIGLEYFIETCKTLPASVKAKLDKLPDIGTLDLNHDEVIWFD